jgi:hypothetical protein
LSSRPKYASWTVEKELSDQERRWVRVSSKTP